MPRRAVAWVIAVVWVLVAVAALPWARTVTQHLQANNLDVAGSPSVWADDRLALLHAPAEAGPVLIGGLRPTTVERVALGSGLPTAWFHPERGGVLLLPPGGTPAAKLAPFVVDVGRQGGSVRAVSTGAIGRQISRDSEATLGRASVIALPVLALLLPIVFGALAQAVMPLVVAALGAELALAVLSVLARHITLSVYLTDIVSFLALGVGVDYALFVTTRFREAMERGLDVEAATREAMRTAGRSVLFSGLAVAVAVSTLLLAGTSYWRGLALGGAIAVACVLLVTHTLLPALLRLLGRRVSWGPVPLAMGRWSLWRRLAEWSTWRPWLSVALGFGLLAVPAVFAVGLRVTLPANLASMLPRGSALRNATALQQRLDGAGSIAPVPLALEFPTTVTEPQTWVWVGRITTALAALPDVRAVASPTSGGATPQTLVHLAAGGGGARGLGSMANFINPTADPHLVALAVTPDSGPDQAATVTLLAAIQTTLDHGLPAGARGAAGGATALIHDFTRHTDRRLPWIVGGAALFALGVLVAATGSWVQATVGVLLDGLVAAATGGILFLTVQRGGLGFAAQPPNLTVVPLVFVLLFGLSMDYEVILLHRIQEGLAAGAKASAAAREGIATTGGMITGAGLVMVVVFIVLVRSPLGVLQTLGIGMTVAILLDTWVVRTFLIPGVTALLGPRAFWPWRPTGRR